MKSLLRIGAVLAASILIATAAETPAAKFGSLVAGTVAPDFVVTTADGKSIKLEDFKGKTVVLNFWTTNRGPATALETVSSEYSAAGVVVIGICAGAAREEFSQAVKKAKGNVSYLLTWDPAGKAASDSGVAKKFGIGAFPTTGVIDPAGKIVGGFTGFGAQSAAVLRDYLRIAGVAIATVAEEKSSNAPAPEPELIALKVGALAPDFSAIDAAGKPVKLSDFTGKIVVLAFWATWCKPALAAMPSAQQIAATAKSQGVVIFAACTSDNRGDFETWMKSDAQKYPDLVFANDPIGRDAPAKYADRVSVKLYGASRLPTFFVIGRDGKVAEVLVGYGDGDDRLEATLQKLDVTF